MREREGEKMKPSSKTKEKSHQNHQFKEKISFQSLSTTICRFFYLTFIAIITIFSLHLIFNNKSINFSNGVHNLNLNQTIAPTKEIETCNLFEGKWIQDANATMYAESCPEIPLEKNCLVRGRKDRDYLNWKWKPDQCELPRFDAVTFLSILRGKKMAFIGDSLARNQVDSLVCLLSSVETPESIYEDRLDQDRTWEFREYNFTLVVVWSPFLVPATKIPRVYGYHIDLDRVDPKWSGELPSIDYAVFSSSHWFYSYNRFHENGSIIGCVRCHLTNLTDVEPGRGIGPAFRLALRAVNGCGKKIVTFVRTFSPQHFEHGYWNTGGKCNRTRPLKEEEVDRAQNGWGYRKIQLEEVEMARTEGTGNGNKFEVLDVTEMMATRADGHPDWFYRLNKVHDCLHWCLPGPVDMWNWLLLEKLKRLDSISSDSIL